MKLGIPYMGSKRKLASEFQEVHAFEHISKMSATNNKKNTIERLFWNGKGEANKHTLF